MTIADLCPPPFPSADALPDLPTPDSGVECDNVVAYYNTAQTFINSCPTGSSTPPISVTVPANTILSFVSQDDADTLAMNRADTVAAAQRALNPCQTPANLLLAEDGTTFIVFEGTLTNVAL